MHRNWALLALAGVAVVLSGCCSQGGRCERVMRPSNTRLERAFRGLRFGMTETEVRQTVNRHIREPWSKDATRLYAEEQIEKRCTFDTGLPIEGSVRAITWDGSGVDGEGLNYYASRVNPTELRVCFGPDGRLSYAYYRCKVELRFPHDDLQLREDGVRPFNYAYGE